LDLEGFFRKHFSLDGLLAQPLADDEPPASDSPARPA
jgi:hypothetical protein